MCRLKIGGVLAVALCLAAAPAPPAVAADPVAACHKRVVRQLEKYKKTYLKLLQRCLDKENRGDIAGPCPDTLTSTKLAATNLKVAANVAKKCTMPILATLGYRSDCHYGEATAGVGGTCFDLPVTTPADLTECLKCWKRAELARYVATLYPSHAEEICGPALDDTSAVCSAVGCTSPLPDQRNLGDGGENDCQRRIGKAGIRYLLKRERTLENCLLKLGSLPTCLVDPKVQLRLATAEMQKEKLIGDGCNNRTPTASPPFCCRTGTGNECTAAASRTECTDVLGGDVQEDKVCGLGGSCENPPGNQRPITWWEHCPTNDPCPGPTLADEDQLADCVDTTADALVAGLLCLQFPNASACATVTPTPTPAATPTPTVTPTSPTVTPTPTPTIPPPCFPCICPPPVTPTPTPTCTAGCPTPTPPTPTPTPQPSTTPSPPPCGTVFGPPQCSFGACAFREVCVDVGGSCGCTSCCPCPP